MLSELSKSILKCILYFGGLRESRPSSILYVEKIKIYKLFSYAPLRWWWFCADMSQFGYSTMKYGSPISHPVANVFCIFLLFWKNRHPNAQNRQILNSEIDILKVYMPNGQVIPQRRCCWFANGIGASWFEQVSISSQSPKGKCTQIFFPHSALWSYVPR